MLSVPASSICNRERSRALRDRTGDGLVSGGASRRRLAQELREEVHRVEAEEVRVRAGQGASRVPVERGQKDLPARVSGRTAAPIHCAGWDRLRMYWQWWESSIALIFSEDINHIIAYSAIHHGLAPLERGPRCPSLELRNERR